VQLIDHIQKEWAVLKAAPLSFVILAVLCLLAGVAVGSWHYSERLEEKDGQLSRYRVALGIDKASPGALIELNNEELRAKALATAANLHAICISFRGKTESLQKELAASKLNDKEKADRTFALMKEESDEFDQTTRSIDADESGIHAASTHDIHQREKATIGAAKGWWQSHDTSLRFGRKALPKFYLYNGGICTMELKQWPNYCQPTLSKH
jgi:hypothetical protein